MRARIITGLLCCAAAYLPAQVAPRPTVAARPETVAPALLHATAPASRVDGACVDGARVDAARGGRGRHARRGAVLGAGLGFVAGAIVGSKVGTGCDVSAGRRCSARRNRIGLVLGFGAEGAVLGAGVGALVGVLLRSQHAPGAAAVPPAP